MKEQIEQLKQNFIEAKHTYEAFGEPLEVYTAALKERHEQVEKEMREANLELLNNVAETAQTRFIAEEALREALKQNYEETGEKTFDDDLSVRVTPKLEYEQSDATRWARDNAPYMLIINDAEFKKAAVAKTLEFVKVVETVSTVIKNL